MEFSTTFYAAIAFIFLSCYYLLFLTSSKPKTTSQKEPPKVGGARLFTGHLHLMDGSSGELPHTILGTLADEYGQAFMIRLGVHRVLVVSTWNLAKEVFTTHDVTVSSRPDLTVNRYLSYDNANFGFAPPYWREIRKLIAVEFLSARRIELQKNLRVSEISQFTKELYKQWETEKDMNASGRVLVDMKQCFGNLNLNLVMRMVAGKRFFAGDNAAETQRCREVMRDFFHFVGMFLPGDALPYLSWLDLGGIKKKMKRTAKELDDIMGGWLAEHREKGVSGENKVQDFMDVMLSLIHKANLPGHYEADTIIKATCMILIFGGTDTTTVELIWTLSLLLNNPHVLKKAQDELDRQVGRERRVDESDISKLVYLQAVIKETLRLYPASPLGGVREFSKDCNVGGYHVPKGTWLFVNLWKVQRDPLIWDDPLEFKPERFLDGHKNVDVKGGDYELMPFGGGRRICPGVNFGMHMLHLVLANFLQAFDISSVNDHEIDMTGSVGLTNLKVTPLDVLVAPRLSSGLY